MYTDALITCLWRAPRYFLGVSNILKTLKKTARKRAGATMRLTTLLFLSAMLIPTISGIIVNPDDIIGEGTCTGPIDTYLCNCLDSNTTIDIELSPGNYSFSQQPSCTLQNKINVTITGSPSNDTIIQCIDGFNINFSDVQNIIIRNLVMIGCGNGVSNDGRYAFYFVGTLKNISISNLYMFNTVGYAIFIVHYFKTSEALFGSPENMELSNIHITSTTVNDDCRDYDYNDNSADFSCSGSGIFIAYIQGNTNVSTLKIDNCSFVNNTNVLPTVKYNEFLGIANNGYKGNKLIPLVGAAGITIFYVQDSYHVTTNISNTRFYNNSGTFSGFVAMIVTNSTNNEIIIENCKFDNNKGIYESSGNDPTTGGIYFLNLQLLVTLSTSKNMMGVEAKLLTVTQSNFINLSGKLGVAFHIEKNSPDSILVEIKIDQCNFTRNKGDSGSAIYAKDRSSSLSYTSVLGGNLNINLINVNADYNKLSTTEDITNNFTINSNTVNFITGVFHISICLVTLTYACDTHCLFQHNQPSVFYGHRSAITINGSISFINNIALYGGALRLLDTVLYISTNTTAQFMSNFATENGGAIKVDFAVTNIQSQDNCPFQFVGLPPQKTIYDNNFTEIKSAMDIYVSFQDNYARNFSYNDLESIFANVFYTCPWYPDTSVHTQLGPNSPVNKTGYRDAVYREAFNYGNASDTDNRIIDNHLNISAIVPCVCNHDDDNDNRQYVVYCLEGKPISNYLPEVVPGRPFVINVTSLDTVGSVGHSSELISNAYNDTSGHSFALNETQRRQQFSVANQSCVEMDFTIYVHTKDESQLNATKGNLTLSVAIPRVITIPFNFVEKCPTGFVLDGADEQYACMCNTFLTEVSNQGFHCNQNSGLITPVRETSWLAAVDGDIQYVELCSPTLCHYNTDISLDLSAPGNGDVLCTNRHAGRACGDCVEGYSRVFGSDSCMKCHNIWLLTILMYAVLGIILIVIIFLLKLTVTVGAINGLIFFCSVMSINEKIFFNDNISRFSFIRLFISIFNLDLGFEICFYNGMDEITKTGLQFVFPVYLWPLIILIVYLSRWSHRFQARVSRTSVPAFATLILLSYAKLLRTAISVFSFVDIQSSKSGTVRAWRPDPSVGYLEGGHIALFVIAVLFLLFIFPFAISFTYPKILHYKKFSYLFPFFDAFVAPYKEKYRFWFGVRALILIYLAITETVIFPDIEALLLSSITVVGTFTIIQAYIRPFKNNLINIFDLSFTGIFLLMSSIVLYLNPTSKGYEESDIVVYFLGSVAFILFCMVIIYHIHYVSKKYTWYIKIIEKFWKKMHEYRENKLIHTFFHISTIQQQTYMDRYHSIENVEISEENRFQESLYEHL